MSPTLLELDEDAEAQARLKYRVWHLIASAVCNPSACDAGKRRRAFTRQLAEEVGALSEDIEDRAEAEGVDGAAVVDEFRVRGEEITRTWNMFDVDRSGEGAQNTGEVLERAVQILSEMERTRRDKAELEMTSDKTLLSCLEFLTQTGDKLIDDVEQVGLGQRHIAEQTTAAYLESEATALEKKLKLIILQASTDAYSSDKRKAVERICEYSSRTLKKDKSRLVDVSNQLERYKSLGAPFRSLAHEYSKLLEEEKSKKRFLKELKEAASNSRKAT